MPQVHLSVPVMEDGILYNLPNIERNILNDGVVEQGPLGSHLTHVRRRNETRRNEVMPDFGDIGQMLGLEVDSVPIIVELPLTQPICQEPNDLGLIEYLVEPIERLRGNRIKIIKLVDRLRAEVYQHTLDPDFLDDMGGEVGVEFSHHTHRSWTRWLEKRPPTLGRNSLAEEVIGVVETIFFDKGSVLADGAEPIGGTFVDKPRDIEIRGRVLTGPTPFSGQLSPLTRHRLNYLSS